MVSEEVRSLLRSPVQKRPMPYQIEQIKRKAPPPFAPALREIKEMDELSDGGDFFQ